MNRNVVVGDRWSTRWCLQLLIIVCCTGTALTQDVLQPVVPKHLRGRNDAERSGMHDAGNIRTIFFNYGMVGSYPDDPINVDLSIIHSA